MIIIVRIYVVPLFIAVESSLLQRLALSGPGPPRRDAQGLAVGVPCGDGKIHGFFQRVNQR